MLMKSCRCRVDYKQAPTINHEVNLSVISKLSLKIQNWFLHFLTYLVPPGEPILVDEDGNQVKRSFGPFFEGETVSISCEVSGGEYCTE